MSMRQGRVFTKKITIDDITFDSEVEGERYLDLKEQERLGQISELVLQPEYKLTDDIEKIDPFNGRLKKFSGMKYVADFRYLNSEGVEVIEDVKGFMFQEFIIKQKLFESIYPDKTITLIVKATKSIGFMEYNDNVDRKKNNKNAKKNEQRALKEKLKKLEILKARRVRYVDRVNELKQKEKLNSTERKRLADLEDNLIPEIDRELLG